MTVEFEIATVLPASPEDIYNAWLDSRQHGSMTGGKAEITPAPAGEFSAWDGYLWGRNLELVPHRRIVQAWRTSDFDADDPDSRLEVLLQPAVEGTLFTIRHTNLPEDGLSYRQGWVDNYFRPMERYFSNGWKGK